VDSEEEFVAALREAFRHDRKPSQSTSTAITVPPRRLAWRTP
jgi:hypothetical protein